MPNEDRAKLAERFRQAAAAPAHPTTTLPRYAISTKINHSPHVVILGAGASRACCPDGDANGRVLPLMADFVDVLGLRTLIGAAGFEVNANFERTYSEIHRASALPLIRELDHATRTYFGQLTLPDHVTLYDRLLLSLRAKDAIITFNWDPLLAQAYKRWRHLGNVLPDLIFLHGNVDIGVNIERNLFGFLSDDVDRERGYVPTPLLYPVDQKNYTDDSFVAEQWLKATDYLSDAYYVTVLGYSAPTTDVEARALLLKAWRDNTTRGLAQFSIFDIRDPEEVERSWKDFVEGAHGGASQDFECNILFRHPRRSCEAFAFATLQQDPWREDRYPADRSLSELETWISPLIDEEATGRLSGTPH